MYSSVPGNTKETPGDLPPPFYTLKTVLTRLQNTCRKLSGHLRMNGIVGKRISELIPTSKYYCPSTPQVSPSALGQSFMKYGTAVTIRLYGQTKNTRCFISTWDTMISTMNTKPIKNFLFNLTTRSKMN